MIVVLLFVSEIEVHRFVAVLGDAHDVALAEPVHGYSVTVDADTVPGLKGSFATMSMSASIGAKSCPLAGPPPESAGTPARDTAAMENVVKTAAAMRKMRVQKNPRDACNIAEPPVFGMNS